MCSLISARKEENKRILLERQCTENGGHDYLSWVIPKKIAPIRLKKSKNSNAAHTPQYFPYGEIPSFLSRWQRTHRPYLKEIPRGQLVDQWGLYHIYGSYFREFWDGFLHCSLIARIFRMHLDHEIHRAIF